MKKLIAWRKENNIDHILEDEVVKKVGVDCSGLVVRTTMICRNVYCTRLIRQIVMEELVFLLVFICSLARCLTLVISTYDIFSVYRFQQMTYFFSIILQKRF